MSTFDPSTFDQSIRPQDDLFGHVNGRWLREVTIDPDKSSAGAFIALRDAAEVAVREILDDLASGAEPAPEGSGQAKARDLYRSFLDEDRAEELGAEPLAGVLERIDAIDSLQDLASYLGWAQRYGLGGFVGMGTDSDPGDPNRYVMFAGQSGLGLPDEVYYRSEQHASIRTAYLGHVRRMLELAGVADAAGDADLVMQLETDIAHCHWDNVRTRDMVQMYNLQPFEQFARTMPSFDWDAALDAAGIAPGTLTEIVNEQPSFFQEVDALLSAERLPAWRAWARWHAVSGLAPYLSPVFVDQNFEFYGRTLQGTEQLRPRWKRGVSLTEGVLGEAIGEIYVARHFPASSKARMDELVGNIVRAYEESIRSLEWMGEATRAEALEKIGRFTAKIGYPVKWRDYSRLDVDAHDLVGNVLRAGEFEFERELRRITEPVDRDEWLMYPQTVNAYYHPLRNEIVFPAAILQPPFFDPDADDALNYGGIGAVIGHEIGHGFDDQGSTCDGSGTLRNWWTDEDRSAFQARTSALVAQYDALVPRQFAGQDDAPHVIGALTLGENIGDLGGLGIAVRAWQFATGGGDHVPPLDGFTGLQRLFLNWARVWQELTRDAALRQRIATDPHSPSEFRCNQVARNVDAFVEAFEVGPGDAMWLDPADRVHIW